MHYLLLFFVTLIAPIAITPLSYAQENSYLVSGVDVSSYIGDYETNKNLALERGAKKAIRTVLKRLSVYDAHWKLGTVNIDDPLARIEEMNIRSERVTSNSYMAKIDYLVMQAAVKESLQKLGMLYATKFSPPTLVLPVFKNCKEELSLWGEEEWHVAWRNIPETVGLMNFIFTQGDLVDISLIDLKDLFDNTKEDFSKLLNRYHAKNLIIIEASDYHNIVEVKLRFLNQDQDSVEYISYSKYANKFYDNMVRDLARKLDARWKGADPFALKYINENLLRLEFSDIKKSIELRKMLENARVVQNLTVKAISNNVMSIKIEHTVNSEVLSDMIRRAGWSVEIKGDLLVVK